jgi:polyisoprenoid-binding protein YceI
MRFVSNIKMVLAASCLLAAVAHADDTPLKSLKVDLTHSKISFEAQAVGYPVPAEFKSFNAQIKMDPAHFEQTKIEISVDVKSISSGCRERDMHLMSSDFFDTANYPEASFRSLKLEKTGEGQYNLKGKLTIRGVSKTVVFPVKQIKSEKDEAGKLHIAFKSETTVDRQDFGIVWTGNISQKDLEENKALLSGNVDPCQVSSQVMLGVTSNEVKVRIQIEAVEE